MSTNYSMMRESESMLLKDFNSYFKYVIDIHQNLYGMLTDATTDNIIHTLDDANYQKIEYQNDKASSIYEDILDDALWMIQKNEPRASHLRFIISLVNSIKDIERISDYVLIIAKFFHKREVSQHVFDIFIDAYKQTNDLISLIYKEFVNKYVEEFREDVNNSIEEYHKYLKNKIRTCVLLFSETDLSIQNKTLIDLITCFGALERTVEHVDNIIKSFYFIK